jgi:hypothetical protein
MLRVLTTSKDDDERGYVKTQLRVARRKLQPGEIEQVDEDIAKYFALDQNLQVELERVCNLMADHPYEAAQWATGASASGASAVPPPQDITRALLRIENVFTTLGLSSDNWRAQAISWLGKARLELPDRVLDALSVIINGIGERGLAGQRDSIDVAFFLNALVVVSTDGQRLETGINVGRIGDVANMIAATGDDPAKSKLVQVEFGRLAEVVRRSFGMASATMLEGGPGGTAMALELKKLLWLNDMLRPVALPEMASPAQETELSDQKAKLLTEDERKNVQDWLGALKLNSDAEDLSVEGGKPSDYQVPDIRQYLPNACGDACLQVLLYSRGRDHLPFGTNDRGLKGIRTGLDPRDLRRQLREQGIGTMYLQPGQFRHASANDLRRWLEEHGPLLATTEDHYVVITGIEGDTVRIQCSLLGPREASVDALNRYVDWSITPSPIQATYDIEPSSKPIVRLPKPHLGYRLVARLYVGGQEKRVTPEWKPVRRHKEP